MASNPMQRKANMYLVIGVVVTLLITGSIIGILTMQYFKLKEEIDTEHNNMQEISVLKTNKASGDTITADDLIKVKVNKSAAPSDSISISSLTENTVSKLELKAGTVITTNMVSDETAETQNDLRIQEYNTIILPSQLEDGQFIDIRLRLPDGTDYIVLPKKKVQIPVINGVESESTIKLQVSEDERLVMNSAIVEAYWVSSSMLYATLYAEAGMQDAATATYIPNNEVMTLIDTDSNIVNVAKTELINRYNASFGSVRGNINNTLGQYSTERESNIQNGVTEEINKIKKERQSYLQSLGGL